MIVPEVKDPMVTVEPPRFLKEVAKKQKCTKKFFAEIITSVLSYSKNV